MQFKLESLLKAARRWSEPDIQKALVVLEQTDRGVKRGADASVALTSAVVAACGGTTAVAPTSRRRAT